MLEHWTALVQQIVDAEFESTFDDPAEGAVMMVCDVMDEEGAVKPVLVNGECVVRETGRVVCALEDGPDLVQSEGRVLEGVLVAKGVETRGSTHCYRV